MQFSVGALAPLMLVDLDLSRTRLGLLLSGYYVLAALTSPLFGRIAERLGARAALQLVASLAIGGNGVLAAVGGQAALAAGLLLAGLAVAAANPATNLALADLPPPHGALMGVKQSGFQMAAVVAGTLMPFVARLHGWRMAFAVAAVLAVAMLLVLTQWPADPARRPAPGWRRRDAEPVAMSGSDSVRTFTWYAFCMGIGTANVGVYLALYTHERLLVPEHQAGAVVAVVGVAAVVARIGWSVLVEGGHSRWGNERSVLVLISSIAVVATATVVVADHSWSWLVWPAAVGLGISAAAWNSVVMLALLRRSAAGRLGTASGQVQGAFFFGLAAGPPVFGLLVDQGGDYAFGWSWTALSFVAALAAVRRLREDRPSLEARTTTEGRQEMR